MIGVRVTYITDYEQPSGQVVMAIAPMDASGR